MDARQSGSVGETGRPGSTALLTAVQVQRMLDLDRSTVYRMAADGRLPAVKVGRQWRFPAQGIADLLRTDLPPAPPEQPEQPEQPADAERVSVPVARSAIELAAEDLGVMMVVTDLEGHPLTPVVNPCPWFAERSSDPALVEVCSADWRGLAQDVDLQPRFHLGPLGFECARAFVRSGDRLVAMVLAGGLAPADGSGSAGLYELGPEDRDRVLRSLSRVAAVIARASRDIDHPPQEGTPR